MIYDFGSTYEVYKYLKEKLPKGSMLRIGKLEKLEKLAVKGDLVIFYGWGKGYRKVQRRLVDKGVQLGLDGETSLKIGDKVKQLKIINEVSRYPLERVYKENSTQELIDYRVPKLNNSKKVVVKIGNTHQGRDKYLKIPNALVRTRENVVFEEYIVAGRSIRILIIKDNIWVVEHKSDGWIKNISPIEVVYNYEEVKHMGIDNIEDIIEDAKKVKDIFNMDYVGVDYVVGIEKTGILEVNDMIGLPENYSVEKAAQKYWYDVCMCYINNI